MGVILTIFWGLVVLLILVLVHELGHFIAARAFGVRVTEFMVGMPGPNIGFEHNGCRYGITCIPLGGYNRITGMEGGPEDPNLEAVLAYVYRHGTADAEHVALSCGISEDDAEFALEVLDGWGSINKPGRSNKMDVYAAPKTAEYALGEARIVEDPKALLDAERSQTYRALSCWKRLVVLFAGPLMNVVLALLILLAMFCVVGLPYATTTIDSVVEDSPAQAVGLQAGDEITSVCGYETRTLSEVSAALAGVQAGDVVQVCYNRDGQESCVELQVAANEQGDPMIGFYAATARMRLGVGDALYAAGSMLVVTVQGYLSLLNPSTAAETLSQSSSVVGISVMARNAASAGALPLMYLLAIVSLSLAVVNLFPVPPLDGGRIMIELTEKVIRRPVSVRAINLVTIIVIVLLVLLFVVLLRQDIVNFILGG